MAAGRRGGDRQITRRLKARSGEASLDTVWMEEWLRESRPRRQGR